MVTVLRKEFKREDAGAIHRLYKKLVTMHETPDHTRDELFNNIETKDFCVVTRHFISSGELRIHYDVVSWLEPLTGSFVTLATSIEEICVYESFMEYERERLQQLHSAPADRRYIPNIN